MYTPKDNQFIERLIASTKKGKLNWTATATPYEFVAALGGKYFVTLKQSLLPVNVAPDFSLNLDSQDGENILKLDSNDYPDLEQLHEHARRRVFKVDEAIDEILQDPDLQN
jgi:hypothetical protein